MIVKGEIGQQFLIKAEITAIQVPRDYRGNGIQTEYILRLHKSDALGDTYIKLLSSDVCFEVPDEVPEEIGTATQLTSLISSLMRTIFHLIKM